MSDALPYERGYGSGHFPGDGDGGGERHGDMDRDEDNGFSETCDPSDTYQSPASSHAVTCPQCASTRTRALQWGRRFGCIVGAVAGVAGGAAAGCIGAPRQSERPLQWVSLISSAVIGGITGGTAGCRNGASLGDLLDDRILPNHRCQDCSKRFNHPKR